jgi:DNA-binding response OmpR family regulator
MNILVFSSNQEVVDFAGDILKRKGHQVDIENKAEIALGRIFKKRYDLLIAEPPDRSDFDFFRSVRLHGNSLKILALLSLDGVAKSFAGEVDAKLNFPCSENEFLERIAKFESTFIPRQEQPLVLGDLVLYPESYEAFREGKKIRLRKKEYQLLEFLMRNQNRVINRHSILEYIWNYNTQAMTNTLDVHMSSLRKKIDKGFPVKMLKTVYGAGYRLSDGS